MSDKKIQGDEEYHYPQDEYVAQPQHDEVSPQGEQGQQAAPPAGKKPMAPLMEFLQRNKRLVLVAVVAVVLLILFQILNYKKKNHEVAAPVAKPAVVQKPVQQPQTVNQNAALEQSLASIRDSGTSNSQRIENLKQQISQLQGQMDQSNQTNAQLKQAMVLLLTQLRDMNDQLQQAKAVQKPSGPPSPQLTYHVRAMIAGRAWLRSSTGLTESVTIGDPIPGFGLVKNIDPILGRITTTSGKVISYGADDF